MNSSLRITIAEDDAATAYTLATHLRSLGFQPLHVAKTAQELIERARLDKPDVLISDVRLASGDGIDASEVVYRERPLPILLVSAYTDEDILRRVEDGHSLGFLVKPVESTDLKVSICQAVKRFETIQKLDERVRELEQQLAERKVLDHAKGIVMKLLRLDEEEAYRRLRKFASDRNLKMVQVAQRIIAAYEPFREMARLITAVPRSL